MLKITQKYNLKKRFAEGAVDGLPMISPSIMPNIKFRGGRGEGGEFRDSGSEGTYLTY